MSDEYYVTTEVRDPTLSAIAIHTLVMSIMMFIIMVIKCVECCGCNKKMGEHELLGPPKTFDERYKASYDKFKVGGRGGGAATNATVDGTNNNKQVPLMSSSLSSVVVGATAV